MVRILRIMRRIVINIRKNKSAADIKLALFDPSYLDHLRYLDTHVLKLNIIRGTVDRYLIDIPAMYGEETFPRWICRKVFTGS